MAFPTLVSSTGGLFNSANSFTYAPAFGFTANAGDLIVVIAEQDGGTGAQTHTYSGSWVKLSDLDASSIILSAAYLVAAGGETAVATITSSLSDHWSALIFRFTGAGIPEWTRASGSSTTPDPPLHTPSGGSSDYFWIAGYGVDTGPTQRANTVDAAGYTNVVESREVSTTGSQLRAGSRTNTAASENPGTFTLDGTETWIGFTISVPPAGAAPTFSLPVDERRTPRRRSLQRV
jgi:hypothetical protein